LNGSKITFTTLSKAFANIEIDATNSFLLDIITSTLVRQAEG
jgi:hypothetical protein